MTTVTAEPAAETGQRRSLSPAAARTLATTTKTVPQTQGTSPRWLLRMLPWVDADAGTYRVNRRLSYPVGGGRLTFTTVGSEIRVVPGELRELPLLRGFGDDDALAALADRFTPQEFQPGQVIVESGRPADRMVVVAHGKAKKTTIGEYGDPVVRTVLAEGDHVGDQVLGGSSGTWDFSVTALTRCTVLVLPASSIQQLNGRSDSLREHVQRMLARPRPAQNRQGEADVPLASGHDGEPELPATFVDYEPAPREYPLSVAQTVLRVHTRVADLYNEPMDQVGQQLRLTIEALRERQEHELVNNRGFGLLHHTDPRQRLHTRTGPPTPDDLDELLARRRKSRFFLAHPRTIAAFRRECTRRGVYPPHTDVEDQPMTAWRGVPLLPCDKIPVTADGTSAILVLRTGVDDEGVVGLHQTGLPDEHAPGLNVRFMGVDEKAVLSWLVSVYYSVAVLVPDALGVLENVEIGR